MANNVTLFFGSRSVSVPTESVIHEHTMTENWVHNAEIQYNAMMEVMKEISVSGVPFFLSTDQHGGTLTQHCWMANTDPTIKNISLGDTVGDCFNLDGIQRVIQQTGGLPNIIVVPGNHDFKKNTTDAALYPTNYNAINSAFSADGMRKYNRYGYCSIKDESRNVKWLVVQPYVINEDPNDTSVAGFLWKFGTEQAKWLIRELSENDGYDIVILRHAPFEGDFIGRDGTTRNNADSSAAMRELEAMLKARISGGNGTVTDSEGVTHTYQFSDLEGNLLGMLHGHLHQEVWRTENGLTAYCADGTLHDMSCVFGVFDRHNKKLRIWKFDKLAVYDELVLDIGLAE